MTTLFKYSNDQIRLTSLEELITVLYL